MKPYLPMNMLPIFRFQSYLVLKPMSAVDVHPATRGFLWRLTLDAQRMKAMMTLLLYGCVGVSATDVFSGKGGSRT